MDLFLTIYKLVPNSIKIFLQEFNYKIIQIRLLIKNSTNSSNHHHHHHQ